MEKCVYILQYKCRGDICVFGCLFTYPFHTNTMSKHFSVVVDKIHPEVCSRTFGVRIGKRGSSPS